LGKWAEELLRESGYLDDLRRAEADPQSAESRVQNVLDLARSLDRNHDGPLPAQRLQEALDELSLDREREEDDSDPGDAVTLITMHSCKGLEFPHVHIVGLEEGLLPHARSASDGSLDEERRLFYVAITRAMRSLALSHCGARKKFGQLSPCHPSRFLAELPQELLEEGGGRKPVSVDAGRALFDGMRAALDSVS